MLLRFGVSNRLSIRDRQELSLTSSSLKDRTDGLIDCASSPTGSIVPAVVIYGANASGKTNLVHSIRAMRSMVLGSHSRGEPGGGVPHRQPFALDVGGSQTPTCFDIDFVMDGVRHHYGFEASDDVFESEWLYAFPKAHRRTLFEREGNEFHFGRALGGPNKTIASLVRPNSLYVSAAAQNGHKQLSNVFLYFRSIHGVDGMAFSGTEASSYFVEEPDHRVIDFLGKVGTGIVDVRRKESELQTKYQTFQREIFAVAQRVLNASFDLDGDVDDKMVTIELAHRGVDGKAAGLNYIFI